MKEERKNYYGLILFGIIVFAFIALRISQFFESRNEDNQNNNQQTNQLANRSTELEVVLEVRTDSAITSIEIDKNGILTFSEIQFGLPAKEAEQITLTGQQQEQLREKITDTGFFNLDYAYRPHEFTSGATLHTISVLLDGTSHSVLCEGDCPETFNQIETAINNLYSK